MATGGSRCGESQVAHAGGNPGCENSIKAHPRAALSSFGIGARAVRAAGRCQDS